MLLVWMVALGKTVIDVFKCDSGAKSWHCFMSPVVKMVMAFLRAKDFGASCGEHFTATPLTLFYQFHGR